MNNLATKATVEGWEKGRKWTYLVNLSKITKKSWDNGRSSIRSMEMSVQDLKEIGKYCKNLVGNKSFSFN